MKYTQFLIFEVCLECNLGGVHGKCPNMHPDRYRGGDRTRPMTDEQIIDAAAKAYAAGFRGAIGFHYYNEPLLAKDRIFRLVAAIRAGNPAARFVLWTNGTKVPGDAAGLDELKGIFDLAWVTAYDGGDYSRLRRVVPKVNVVKWGLDNRASDPLQKDNRASCCRMFSELIFDYYGNAHFCCIDWRGDIKIGNLHDQDFAAIWGRFAEYRGAASHEPMLPGAPAACLRCVGRHPTIAPLIPEIMMDAKRDLPHLRAAALAKVNAQKAPPPRGAPVPAAVFVAYRLPEQRLRDHFRWNDAEYRAKGIRVYVVVDRVYDGLPDYVRQLVYEDEMPVFSLAKTKNRGIRHAIEAGHSPIIATDSDILFPADALEQAIRTPAGTADVPHYWMADDESCASYVPAPKATGTVTMTADDWRRIHYHEGCEGYGSDDGILLHAIVKHKLRVDRGKHVWHIAHVAGTPQKEFDQAKPRVDHWGRGDGFNPENFAGNRKFYARPIYESPLWGLGGADITFVLTHYRMPEQRLRDCLRWNTRLWREIGARVLVVSDRDGYPDLPEWVRVAKYPVPLTKFNLSKCSNYGIRLAGSGIIVKTDPDIYWTPEAIRQVAGVTDSLGACPILHMAAGETEDQRKRAQAWTASKGVLALAWEHWQAICGYDERMEGYGIEDGDAFHRAGVMLRPARDVVRETYVWHIAHTPQAQTHGNTRMDCWGRLSGFNPRSHAQNQAARQREPWHCADWGLA
jgi:hypothetical protein